MKNIMIFGKKGVVVVRLLIFTIILFMSCDDSNPVATKSPSKVYDNYDLIGNLGNGSGIYFTIIIPTTTEKVLSVRVRKDENSSWEEWTNWNFSVSEHKLHILDYSLKIMNWDYWITVRAWEIKYNS